ncbi:energy-coupled thiamine transporter ThiT [Alkalithermobacter paradoxus]|uniref:Thiamine transporter ThiT n=1 Tax=Alkalithermobacter paradoxus TaxID=29349 RepID=A0A1V4I6F6_9FIRM|nr:thiamine transporter ThiT [[Clostridium] thermoalcaliphilum]
MKQMSTKMLVEAGVMIALAQILSYIKIFEAPYGGSITAASMVPIIVYSIRWGLKPGLLVGTVYGILQFILGPKYSYHILSILFDYVVAFGALGLAGLFRKNIQGIFLGVFLGIFGRFVFHVISGAIVWGIYAPEGTNPWIYSILYNGSYLLPELIISYVVFGLIYRPLKSLSLS